MALVAERMRRVALAAAAAVESSFWTRASSPVARGKGLLAAEGAASELAGASSEGSSEVWGNRESGRRGGFPGVVHAKDVGKGGGQGRGWLSSLPLLGSTSSHVSVQVPGMQHQAWHQRNGHKVSHKLSMDFGVTGQRRGITSLPHLGGVAAPAIREERVGLYGYNGLMDPQGFRVLVREAIETSEGIIHDIRHAAPSVAIVRGLDDISNTVCTVLDAAELCRNTHPDREWVEEADRAYLELSRYVQSLNTNTTLFGALVSAMEGGCIEGEEASRVAAMLRMDFERGGIYLPEEKRAQVEALNNRSTRLGMQFGANIINDSGFVDIYPASRLRNVPITVQSTLQRVQKQDWPGVVRTGTRVPTDPMTVQSVLKWVEEPEVRRQVYLAGHSTPRANLPVLDELIATRHEVAQLLGFNSYADFFLRPLMARTPDAVVTFLETLSTELKGPAEKEFALLSQVKQQYEPGSPVRSWDRGYYVGLLKAKAHNLDARVIAEYFSLEHCLAGLALLTSRLFGMALREVPLAPGEGWANGVRKFVLTHQDEGVLGVIYLDLFPRTGKYTHAAHFTLRCGRRQGDHDWQLPAVALVCNLPPPQNGAPSLLSHGEVETMFHEFGHALHTLLSRTEYQHLSGTRGKLDFIETPSNLLELFVDDHRVLRHFARHYSTGEAIPPEVVSGLRQSKRMFSAMDLQVQVVYSLMDQAFFGPQSVGGVDTTAVIAQLQEQHTPIGHVEGTCWQARFNHLVGYGAGYYSYLYAKAFSSELWAQYFAADPLNREAGEMLRRDVLQYGGSRDPLRILKHVLGEHSMKETGSGGIVPNTESMMINYGL